MSKVNEIDGQAVCDALLAMFREAGFAERCILQYYHKLFGIFQIPNEE